MPTTRRSFLVAPTTALSVGGSFGVKEKPRVKKAVIPPEIMKEIVIILESGGRITGFSYRKPSEYYKGEESFGQRFLVEERQQRWRVV